MVRTELKVRYKNSALGFAWSLVNPLLYLVVFYIAFDLILGAGIPAFPLFLLSGLLVWNLFSAGLGAATGAVVGNAGLIKKVSFPREILPLASIGAALVHFFLQSAVLAAAFLVTRWNVAWAYIPLLPLALDRAAAAHGRARDPPRIDQRVPAGHAALPRAGAARVVLDDPDRLRVHDDREPRRVGREGLHAEPDHAGRPLVPARALREDWHGRAGRWLGRRARRTRPGRRSSRTGRGRTTSGTSATPRPRESSLFTFGLYVFGRLEANFAEEL